MTVVRTRIVRGTLGIAAASALLAVGATPAQAGTAHNHSATGGYVALGDSYASGEGLAPYADGSGTCDRSATRSYPALLATYGPRRFDDLTSLACTGATTGAVLADQVPAIDPTAETITLTVGGNDLGFSSVLAACLSSPVPAVQSTLPGGAGCRNLLDAPLNAATAYLGGPVGVPSVPAADGRPRQTVATVVAAVAKQAPDAQILVSGYPQLFGPASASCQVSTVAPIFVAQDDVNWFRTKTTALNQAIKAGVDQARVAVAASSTSTTAASAVTTGKVTTAKSASVKAESSKAAGSKAAGSKAAGSKAQASRARYVRSRITYVDPTRFFAGHGLCDERSYINGLVPATPGSASAFATSSFHPTARGQAAYAASFVLTCYDRR